MSHTAPLIFVIYDGIEHSIFESQVLAPLLKRLHEHKTLHAVLVSFETVYPKAALLKRLNKAHPRLTWKIISRGPFLGVLSVYKAAYYLRKVLQKYTTYTLTARGPLAGAIAARALSARCKKFVIQARGLLAEEYRYATQNATGVLSWLYYCRYKQLHYHEQKAYNPTLPASVSFAIETVSMALQEYLIKTYHVSKGCFINAEWDMPKTIQPAVKTEYRLKYRAMIGAQENTTVYIYSGSAKPWQCPKQTITYFKTVLKKEPNSFLLILSTQPKVFKKICKESKLPSKVYKILQVSYHSLFSYLCAGDKGLLFRDPDIINWVSRPTKYLEYKAVGLTIVHNHTVACLEQEG